MHDFSVLVLPGAYASSVANTLDILGTAAVLAPRLRLPRPRWRLLSPQGGDVALSSGMRIGTRALPGRAGADVSTWIVPGLGVDNPPELAARLARDDAALAIAALRRHGARGGAVAASCSAVFLLQAGGLLRGRRVTTSWWLASELRRLQPDCVVDADRMVCADGPVSSAGAAFAQSDLMLHLLRSRFGTALADVVGKVLLIDGRQAQAPFVVPSMLSNGNELVRRLTQRIEAALPRPPSVAALAEEFAMSPRTLARHVRAATGTGALALVQSVRLNRARALIESSRMTIEQVAAQVGYEDATALRRLMRRSAGATPSRFRSGSRSV
ncbi:MULTISPECIES: helix-turn-helix domain-containing protein [unclassified Lysobacter]|uniref:GlxA family transcriptional regulator n=1 Tax=unclassified Lysobacter TaxID=2635362 RepID=UPI0006FA7531|nr:MULTISPECIES: helix-turn-helix domain-containing protein [unclassified Lysobacter]KQZ60247.1 AraC family transcriptional regulator [Lysobacter sp. Root559]KRC38689.1 AraC family transcriptional regulator [Lysobacter sp. Root76]KRD71108.1 AraC family transcriptional regulator [Lysobacter sp. Root96]